MQLFIKDKEVSQKRINSFYKKLKNVNGCLEYQGAKNATGYGWVLVNRTPMIASRFAYFLAYGKLESSKLFVLHKCDNPPCCNPDHLFVGTAKDNSDDMIRKGRKIMPKGDTWKRRKLTKNEVIDIWFSEETGRSLAKKYGVTVNTIYNILSKRSWLSVTDDL